MSIANPESPRLGGLIIEELRNEPPRLPAHCVGIRRAGVFARIHPDSTDFYTLLEFAHVAAAIIEGAYIYNPAEEEFIMTDEFRLAYAIAADRALVRFATPNDHPIRAPKPEVFPTLKGRSTPRMTVMYRPRS